MCFVAGICAILSQWGRSVKMHEMCDKLLKYHKKCIILRFVPLAQWTKRIYNGNKEQWENNS